ncbi:matrixin family metalloprotease [uncultured Pseudosulfitobacter sp.]|uniref:matrixin family metalloprotease n=1 Tax=uncultured Pseudosulfitobacter sp. TaxID=2854214 RepID=UPI0030D78AEC|tara:strand:+ start:14722 stop:16290 length:1569 start_codon:yes stop_codon:yes gene_type:complete
MALYTGTHPTTYIGYDTDLNDDDQNTDAQISGNTWDLSNTRTLAFSFLKYEEEKNYYDSAYNETEFTEVWKTQARLALLEFTKVTDITFEEQAQPTDVTDAINNGSDGVLRFATADGMSTAFGYYPNSGESGGDMMFNYSNYDDNANIGTYTYATMMHEIGHTMGLKHGHETNGPGSLTADKDSMEYSIMTYHAHIGDPAPFYTVADGHYAQTLMMYDISAIQRMYGADFSKEAGDTVYTFDTTTGEMFINGVGQTAARDDFNTLSNVTFRTVWDGNGKDTYDLSNFTNDMLIDLTPGGYSDFDVNGNDLRAMLNQGWDENGSWVGASAIEYARGHLFNALQYEGDVRSLIERAIGGTGDDTMIGNVANNKLYGGEGDDQLLGNNGRDDLRGDAGTDIIYGGNGYDFIRGGKDRDYIYGDNGNDKINGNKGRDIITGGKGDDTLTGGAGADKFKFAKNDGDDNITDFELAFDTLVIDIDKSASPITGSTVGGDFVIDYGYGETITLDGLAGITLADIDIILT